jgi:tetratricopeptide (TPR) repeat protein
MKRGAVPGIPVLFSLFLSACTVGTHAYWQDSGYYLSAVRDLSVLYPHGFVLYLCLCKAWTFLAAPVVGFTLAVHLFSSLMAAAGASFAALAARDFLRRLDPSKPAELPAIGAGCILAAGYCYGHAAIIAKTYALSYALLSLLLWLLVKAERKRDFVAMGAVLGLSWAAHPAAALLVPGLLVYSWARRNLIRDWGWGFFAGILALAAACAFLPCLLLPVLASRELLNDMGNPRTLREVVSFVLGEQYVGKPASFGFAAWRWTSGFRYIGEEYLAGALPLLLGAWVLVRKHPRTFGLLAGWIVPVLCVTLLFLAEGQFDQWLVFAFIPMALVVAVGLSSIQDRGVRTIVGAVVAVCGTSAAVNIPLLSQKGYVWAEQYARLLMKNLEPGSVLFLWRDDPLAICRYLQGLPGERTDVLPLNSRTLGEAWLDQRIARRTGLVIPEYGPLRLLQGDASWESVAVTAFANENIGRVPAVFTDIKPSDVLLREGLAMVPAGMLWKIAPREQAKIDLRYWDYPLRPEDIPRTFRRARGHWAYETPKGSEMRSELYEDRLFLPLLSARTRLADVYLPREPEEALRLYESVSALNPEALQEPRFAYHLGLAYYTTNRGGPAARVWEELLTAKPPAEIEVYLQFYLGELHHEARRAELAVQYYQKALTLNPPPDLLKVIEGRLQGK